MALFQIDVKVVLSELFYNPVYCFNMGLVEVFDGDKNVIKV